MKAAPPHLDPKGAPMNLALSRRTLLAALSLSGLPAAGWAQDAWPSKPVRLVVPFPPGGGTDVLARMLVDRLRPLLGQPVVIDNRPGATGNIGNSVVAKSPADGYTLLMQGTIIGMFPHLFQKLNYDPLKDLAAVGMVAESPYVVVSNLDSPFQTVQDIVKAGKADPSKPLAYSTAGAGSPSHLAMEQFASLAGIKLQHITYRGTAPALNDLVGGQVQLGSFSLSGLLSLIQAKRIRVLAVMTEKRSAQLPGIPTLSELGFPKVDASIRFGLFVPAGTPPDIVAKLAATNNNALADPSLREAFVKSGYEVMTSTPEQMAAMVQREHDVWGPVVKALGLQPE
jgi:tripartite-type tricarboxylate transporter receptor subunit TctC